MSIQQILRNALPFIATHGYKGAVVAGNSTISRNALAILFATPPSQVKSYSMNREQLIEEARGEKAFGRNESDSSIGGLDLMEAWLAEGRRVMIKDMEGFTGEEAIRIGMESRLRYNQSVLKALPDGLALLTAPAFPLPTPYLQHVVDIAQDLSFASKDSSQGMDWYLQRGRLATIYSAAELFLISPANERMEPVDRINSTITLVDRMFKTAAAGHQRVRDASLFGTFIVRSWAGLFRSAGL